MMWAYFWFFEAMRKKTEINFCSPAYNYYCIITHNAQYCTLYSWNYTHQGCVIISFVYFIYYLLLLLLLDYYYYLYFCHLILYSKRACTWCVYRTGCHHVIPVTHAGSKTKSRLWAPCARAYTYVFSCSAVVRKINTNIM